MRELEPEEVHEEFGRQQLDDQYFAPPYEDNPYVGMPEDNDEAEED